MKTNLKHISRRTISLILCILMMLSTLMVGTITANAAFNIGGSNVKFYFADNDSWGACNMYYWGDGWSSNKDFTKITNTNIYYFNFDGTWNNLTGYKFRSDTNWTKQSSGDITSARTANTWFLGSSTEPHSTMANLNGEAKVVCMLSTDGTTYKATADSNCRATVSGYNLADGATSTTSVSATTGTNNYATIKAAYGSTINYSATAGTGYTFKGFSSTNSSSLPSSLSATKSKTASGIKGNANTTYYAYFEKEQTTITHSVNTSGSNFTATGTGEYEKDANVTVNLTAASKYMITGVDVTPSTLTYSYNESTKTVTFTMPEEDVTITVNTEKDYSQSTLAVQGRFKVRTAEGASTYKYTGTNEGDWSDSSTNTNITFTYDSTDKVFKLNTYMTVKELSDTTKGKQFFRFYLDGVGYGRSSSVGDFAFTDTVKSGSFTQTTSNSFYFNGTDNEGLVVLVFDPYNNTLTYEFGQSTIIKYDINDGTAPDANGSIEGFYSDQGCTNAITQAREGDRVYVKVTPNTGYKLNTLTAGTTDIKANKYFTMPGSAVTVTATFAEDTSTSYSLVFDTGSTSSYNFDKKSGETALSIGYAEVTLTKGTTYKFKIHSTSGSKYGNTGTMTSASSNQVWNFTSGEVSCGITPSVTGKYIFKWDYTGDTRALTVTFPTYEATISAGTGGSVDQTSINGATTVTATPDAGYVFDRWVVKEGDAEKVTVADANSASTTITPLANGGTVTAKFALAYSVTVTGADCNSTPADLSKVKEGTAVTITLPSGAGYNFSVDVSGVANYTFENRVVSFTMPASNVTITVSTTYDITVTTPTNGTASVSKTPAAANEEITVTANPADGYELNAITVTGATVTNNKFTMPAKPVTVTVTFKETLHTVTITNNVNSTTSTKQVGKITPVDISAGAITGYNFSTWEVVSGTATITDPTSADTSVKAFTDATIKAVYTEDLTTGWELGGNFENPSDANDWVFKASAKKPGESSSDISYVYVDLLADTTYQFKYVVNRNASGTAWYGLSNTTITDTIKDYTLYANNDNCKIKTTYAGTYVFKWDSVNKKVSITYPEPGETTKYDLTINAPTPINSYVTNYSVTYTKDRAETTETVAKGTTIQVDEGSTVTITANEIKGADSSDIVSVESWFVNGSEDKTKNTKLLTLSGITQNTTVYPKVYGKISVSSLTVANTDNTAVNPTATVVMGKSADQAGGSAKYKPVVKVKDSLGNVNTFYGAVVNASAITIGQPYTFAPIEITGLSKGSYTVTAEIIGYNGSDTQVAYGASAEKAMDYGFSYKETAYTGENVAWVDAVPSYKGGDKATLIKWNNHTGNNKTATDTYVFYLPNSVDMSNVTIYHDFTSLKIGDQAITSGSSYSFTTNTNYSLTRNGSQSGNVKFMKGSQNSTQLYLNTKDSTTGAAYDLPTTTDPKYNTKGTVECKGNSIAVDQMGNVNSYELKKLKGRGNSSWEASYKFFGKYAYNITLKNSASLFGLAGDNKNGNTKYSLLANNADEAQVRNSYIYKLAKELGFEYFPNFQMAELYDNGVYLGSYLICQKVELGKKGMITEPEIKYVDKDAEGNDIEFTTVKGVYDGSTSTNKIDNCTYKYSSNRTDPTNYKTGGTYLLEFELKDRTDAEASWFISNKGQPIVVSSPEYASKDEMEFIIGKWNAVESAVYGDIKDGKKQTIDDVRDKIDVESFAKMYLIQELTKNLDGCSTSYNILYKSAEDKFYAEPVWDYDWTLGQYEKDIKKVVGSPSDASTKLADTDGFFSRYKGMGGDSTSVRDFEAELCNNPSFWADVQTIWKNEFYTVATAQNTYLTNTYIPGIKDTILMNENRWGFIESDPLQTNNWGSKDTADTFDGVTKYTTNWITARLNWLNGKITPTMYTVKAGTGATMTYMDNMGNGKLNAYTQFAEGTRLTFTAARQQGMEFKGWSTNGKDVVGSLGKNLTMTVTVNGEATYTPIFAMTYDVKTKSVTYYVDMHGDSGLKPTINFIDSNGVTQSRELAKVGSSTVYSGTYDTEYYVDKNQNLVDIATKISTITADGKNLALTSANALTKKCLETGEVWIEATQSIANAEATNNSTQAKGATITNSTTKRIYWSNNYDVLGSPCAYYWLRNSDNTEKTYVTWDNSPAMTQLSTGSSIFYIDVPKEVNRVIFKGSKGQTVNITLTDTEYAFAPGDDQNKDGNNYCAYKWTTMPADPTPISYTSSYELYDDDTTGKHSIAPTLNPNANATYSVADSKVATVSATGVITPKAIGTTKVTITITGTSKDTATVETTIKVIDRPVIATPAYAIMSYQSNTSSFQAVGGTLGNLTTELTGSAYNGVTTGGIIDTENNTVKYAIADPTVTAYADLAVTVTAPSSGNTNYVFVDWTKNNNAISGANETLTVTLNTASTDKYIVTYQLDSVQVVFTYKFKDYDTSGGYEYVEGGPTKPASYKTAPKTVHASAIKQEGNGYVVTTELQNAAETNMPNIISNYFRYSLDKTTVSAPTMVDGIYYVTATMTNTARQYKVSVNGEEVGNYFFQQEVALDATNAVYGVSESDTGYVWKIDGQTTPISDKKVYTLKVGGDTKLIVAASDGSKTIKNLSAINATFYEIKTNNNKNYVGQNFYIQNFYRQNDPVYDEDGKEVAGATDKTFEGAGVLSYNATYDSTTKTYKPVSATVRNFDYTNKTSLLGVARSIGVNGTGNSESNSIHTASGLNYSFVKSSDTEDNVTGQKFMKYSQTQGCYSYFYQAVTEQSKLYRSQYYVVYSYYVYSYKLNGKTEYVYVMSDQYATAKVYATESN